jgi:uncharacterized repeat protein (TIGR01451 family)
MRSSTRRSSTGVDQVEREGEGVITPNRPHCRWTAAVLLGLALPTGVGLLAAQTPLQLDGTGDNAKPAAAARGDPCVHLEKTGPSSANLGQPVTYQITVRNVGPVAVGQVHVEDRLPNGVRFRGAEPRPEVHGEILSWDLGDLKPSEERHLRIEIEPTTEGLLQSSAKVTYSSATGVQTHITRPRLTVAKTGPESVVVNDPAAFQISVTNAGNGPATGVMVRDELPEGLSHPQGKVVESGLGTLGPGETKSLTLETTAVRPGRFANTVRVTGDGGLEATAQALLTVMEPGLTLRKQGPTQRYLGREAEFDLEVENPGTAPTQEVVVIDTIPEGFEFANATDGGAYEAASRQVAWNLGTIAPGQRRGMSLKLIARIAGDWKNQAVARGRRVPEATAEAPIHLEGVPALMLEVVDLDDPVEVGAETTYEIRVVSQGNCPTTNLKIVASVPAGMASVEAKGPTEAHVHGSLVSFDPLPKLAARADALYRVRVRAVQPGDWRFKVEMSSEQQPEPVREDESTRVYDDQEK